MEAAEFDAWVTRRAPELHRAACLLTGDWAQAQDLVQHACAITWRKWSSIEEPDAYVRAVMAKTASAWWRRKWRGEVPTADLPEAAPNDPWRAIDRRDILARTLRSLPAKQRAVLVLRFYDDLSEAETAELLNWPIGTVKSTTSRALAALREAGIYDEAEVSR